MGQTPEFFPPVSRRAGWWVLPLLVLLCLHVANACATDIADWAPTPPMGWNSWDVYGQSVTESEVRVNADYMSANLKYGFGAVNPLTRMILGLYGQN